MKAGKKILSVFLSVLLVFSAFSMLGTVSFAENGWTLVPSHDSNSLADGAYWFDLDGMCEAELAGIDPDDPLYAEGVAFYANASVYLSDDGTTVRITSSNQVFDFVLADNAACRSFLHQHLGTAEHFTLLPTADSDALNNGDYWFDLNGMRDAELAGLDPEDPRYAEGVTLYQNASVYLSDDGTIIRVLIGDTMFDIALADNAFWQSFLHQHVIPGEPIAGYTLLPKADSDALNDGDCWFDFDGILAANTHGLDKNAPEYIEVVQAIANAYVYLKNDHTSIKIFFNGVIGDLSPGDPDEAGWMYFVRVHGRPQFNGFTLLPGADSEDLAAGAYWYDKAAYMDSLTQDLDPADEEDAFVIWMYNEIYGKRFYYLSDDGQTLKVYQNPLSMADIARSDADSEEYFGFLKQHEAPVEIVNENTGVILTADAGVVPATTVLVVEPAAVDATGIVIEETVNLAERQSLIYDVKLQDGSGNEVQPDGFVTVKIPVPDGYNTDNIKVFYIAPDGAATEIPCTVADGFVSFITNHFSNYAVVDMTCLHNGATEIRGAVTATCKTDGYTGDTYCLGCGEEIAAGAVISKETVAHTPGAAVKENVVNATTDHGGSYDEVVRCTVCGAVISSTHKTTDPLPKPVDPKPENLCKWCGKTHDGFFQKIVGFFHNIFAAIFGARY